MLELLELRSADGRKLGLDDVQIVPGHAEWRPSDASTLHVETDTIPKDNLL